MQFQQKAIHKGTINFNTQNIRYQIKWFEYLSVLQKLFFHKLKIILCNLKSTKFRCLQYILLM